MPYIKKKERAKLDKIIKSMAAWPIVADGDLNYMLFKYCRDHVPRSYNHLKNYIGELRQCATEIERRILGPYEDEKIRENGDV